MKNILNKIVKIFDNKEKRNLNNMDRICRDANGELMEYCIKEYHQFRDGRM